MPFVAEGIRDNVSFMAIQFVKIMIMTDDVTCMWFEDVEDGFIYIDFTLMLCLG